MSLQELGPKQGYESTLKGLGHEWEAYEHTERMSPCYSALPGIWDGCPSQFNTTVGNGFVSFPPTAPVDRGPKETTGHISHISFR